MHYYVVFADPVTLKENYIQQRLYKHKTKIKTEHTLLI